MGYNVNICRFDAPKELILVDPFLCFRIIRMKAVEDLCLQKQSGPLFSLLCQECDQHITTKVDSIIHQVIVHGILSVMLLDNIIFVVKFVSIQDC